MEMLSLFLCFSVETFTISRSASPYSIALIPRFSKILKFVNNCRDIEPVFR